MASYVDRKADLLTGNSVSKRQVPLDVARGCAVLGMIYMHLVPTDGAKTALEGFWTGLARFLDGKSAALFCILAGMSWSIQAQRAKDSPGFLPYLLRRSLSLGLVGLLLHLRIWPTEILIPLALMMPLSLAIRRCGPKAIVFATALLIVAGPLLMARFGAYATLDWNEDGGHLADHALGWVTLRYLLFDGNYPLVPWLIFPLVGMVLVAQDWTDTTRTKNIFWGAIALALGAHCLAGWAEAHASSLGAWTPYLSSTWVPTSIPFLLITGASATALIVGLIGWQTLWQLPPSTRLLSSLGRASLTHYLLHICLAIVPLRLAFPAEEWSVPIGLSAFTLYIALAIPCSTLWFRRFRRGPLESIWALLSGNRRTS